MTHYAELGVLSNSQKDQLTLVSAGIVLDALSRRLVSENIARNKILRNSQTPQFPLETGRGMGEVARDAVRLGTPPSWRRMEGRRPVARKARSRCARLVPSQDHEDTQDNHE